MTMYQLEYAMQACREHASFKPSVCGMVYGEEEQAWEERGERRALAGHQKRERRGCLELV